MSLSQFLIETPHGLIPYLNGSQVEATVMNGEKSAFAIWLVTPFKESGYNVSRFGLIKFIVRHFSEAQIHNHAPKPLSGSVSDVRISHDAFLATKGERDRVCVRNDKRRTYYEVLLEEGEFEE